MADDIFSAHKDSMKQSHGFLKWRNLTKLRLYNKDVILNICKLHRRETNSMHLSKKYVESLRPSDAYICVSKQNIISSDNGLSPERRQAIIWTNAGILLIGPMGTNFNEILIEIYIFSFKKIHLKTSSAKWWPYCLDLNVLILLLRRPECFGRTWSISQLLMPWLLASPGHQQQCYWLLN